MRTCNTLAAKIVLVAALILSSNTASLSRDGNEKQKILGTWRYNKNNFDSDALKKERVFTNFSFKPEGSVEVMDVLLDGIGPGMGEGLGDTGKYRLQSGRLVIWSGPDPQNGWPAGGYKGQRVRYSCRIEFAPDWQAFRLNRCAIAGVWLRTGG